MDFSCSNPGGSLLRDRTLAQRSRYESAETAAFFQRKLAGESRFLLAIVLVKDRAAILRTVVAELFVLHGRVNMPQKYREVFHN